MNAIALPPPDALFVPDADVWTQPFWDSCRARRLSIPCCGNCGTFRMPPSAFCPVCQSQELNWVETSGNGIVYSFTIVATAIVSAVADNIPYVPAVISIPEGGNVRLITNIIDCPVDEISIDMPVHVAWHERADGWVVPYFQSGVAP
jgi:uncharacterized OB-fold protein